MLLLSTVYLTSLPKSFLIPLCFCPLTEQFSTAKPSTTLYLKSAKHPTLYSASFHFSLHATAASQYGNSHARSHSQAQAIRTSTKHKHIPLRVSESRRRAAIKDDKGVVCAARTNTYAGYLDLCTRPIIDGHSLLCTYPLTQVS